MYNNMGSRMGDAPPSRAELEAERTTGWTAHAGGAANDPNCEPEDFED